MPWVLGGCGCLALILIAVAIAGWMVYRAKQRVTEFQTNVKSSIEQAAREQQRSASSPAATTTTTTTPPTRTSVPRAGWNIYVNEKDKLPSGLQSKFVAFSFQYPRTFELQPQSDANFVKVEKYAPAGKPNTAENFAVGYARFDDPNTESETLYDQLLDQLGQQIGAGFHNYKEVKRDYTTIDGTKCRTALFQADFANAPQIKIFGKTIVVHPRGKAYGVTILMLGTSMSRDIKSAEDLGTKGDTADIVRSFTFL
jgi:type II secretory pathway pseudopilin PulG